MSEWRTIDSAPKNRPIDLGQRYMSRGKARFKRVPDCYWHKKTGRWNCIHRDRDGYSLLRLPFAPTHWMEITPPPHDGIGER
jgi:hypothetical protein